jgi:hypothetical protein
MNDMDDYSLDHKNAFALWRDGGCSLKGLTDDALAALTEDPNFRADVGAERIRRLKAAAAPVAPAPTGRSVQKVFGLDSDAFATAIVDTIAAAVGPLRTRIAELEQREYQGVWSAEKAYAKGAMVSRQGSVWHSTVNNNLSTPGQHPHWTLVVKAGRDLRDGGKVDRDVER